MSVPVYLAQLTDSLSGDYSAHDSLIRLVNAEAAARQPEISHSDMITILSISVIVFIFGSFLAYNVFNNRYWARGIFPPMMLNRRSNHYEAIINISINILRCDVNDYQDKQQYIAGFIRKKFPDIQGSMADSIRSAIDLPVTVESVAHWLNKHTKQQEKEELLAFFFRLASLDDVVGTREQEMLRVFSEKMKLKPELLEQLLDDHRREKGERIQSEWERSRKTDASASFYRTEKACDVLGIPVSCTPEEVKKAYRKLAKQYHPDKFQQNNAQVREEAEAKFREIQEAYDYLQEHIA